MALPLTPLQPATKATFPFGSGIFWVKGTERLKIVVSVGGYRGM